MAKSFVEWPTDPDFWYPGAGVSVTRPSQSFATLGSRKLLTVIGGLMIMVNKSCSMKVH